MKAFSAIALASTILAASTFWYYSSSAISNEPVKIAENSGALVAVPAQDPHTENTTASAPRQPGEAKSNIPKIAAKYMRRDSYGALLQQALASGDEEEIKYAKNYFFRCNNGIFRTRASTKLPTEVTPTEIIRAVADMERFCTDALQGRSLSEVSAALEAADRSASSQMRPSSGWQAVVRAVGKPDAEEMIEAFSRLTPTELDAILSSSQLTRLGDGDSADNKVLGYTMAFTVAVCQRFSCDIQYHRAFYCLNFSSCSEQQFDQQLKYVFGHVQKSDLDSRWNNSTMVASALLSRATAESRR